MSYFSCFSKWNECNHSDQSRLTNDHEGEKVSIEEVKQNRLVPRFHTDDGSDQVNEGDGLEGDGTQDSELLEARLLCISSYFLF